MPYALTLAYAVCLLHMAVHTLQVKSVCTRAACCATAACNLCCIHTPKRSADAVAGRVSIVRVDMQGVLSLKGNSLVDAVYVYITPASMEAWAQQQSLRQAAYVHTENDAVHSHRPSCDALL